MNGVGNGNPQPWHGASNPARFIAIRNIPIIEATSPVWSCSSSSTETILVPPHLYQYLSKGIHGIGVLFPILFSGLVTQFPVLFANLTDKPLHLELLGMNRGFRVDFTH